MNARQRLYAIEYLKDFNATQAAIRAGYAEKRADQTGYVLLRNAEVKRAISDGIEQLIGDRQNDLALAIRYWRDVLLDEKAGKTIRMRASENLAKYAGAFIERHEVTGANGSPLLPDRVTVELIPGRKPIGGKDE